MKTQTHEKGKDTCSTPREVEALGWHGLLVTEGAVLRALHGSSAIEPPAAVHTVVSNPLTACANRPLGVRPQGTDEGGGMSLLPGMGEPSSGQVFCGCGRRP